MVNKIFGTMVSKTKDTLVACKNLLNRRVAAAVGIEDNEDQLRWDNLMSFAAVALFLWIIVQTSPNAKTLVTTLIQQAQTAISNLFSSIGSL